MCASVSSYLTPDDTHYLCVFCLGEEHARDVIEGAICVHCELFSMRKLRSPLSLFSRKEGSHLLPAVQDPLLPRHEGNELVGLEKKGGSG